MQVISQSPWFASSLNQQRLVACCIHVMGKKDALSCISWDVAVTVISDLLRRTKETNFTIGCAMVEPSPLDQGFSAQVTLGGIATLRGVVVRLIRNAPTSHSRLLAYGATTFPLGGVVLYFPFPLVCVCLIPGVPE